MIGRLPTQLEIDGLMYGIRTDYRDCLLILEAFNDIELTHEEATMVMLEILYKDMPDNLEEATKKALWFLNCGDDSAEDKITEKPVYDWNQDEQMIFAEINKVAGHEIRLDEYMHFWTFIGLFQGIGEGYFSVVLSIRNKLNKGKSLDKTEDEFYKRNKNLIRLKPKLSQAEQEQYDFINALYG